MTEIEKLREAIEGYEARAQEIIEDFKERLDKNPLYALEWSLGAFEAAAKIDEAATAHNYVRAIERGNLTTGQALEKLEKQMIQSLRMGTRLNGSSSPTSNLAEQARMVVASEWLPDGQSYVKWAFERAVEAS